MAEGIVDRLEAIEIDQQQREALALPPLPRQRISMWLAQQHPVGKAGERIVMRHVGDLVLRCACVR